MIEIRFHGRGGQGGVVASELLAQAAFLDGKMPQSFPFFGVERRGAPVTAYTRIDDRPIALRTSITSPDVVVVLDPGLLHAVPVTDGLKEGGLILANTVLPPEELAAPVRARAATVDARSIALAHGLGSPMLPIVNTAILGALAKATGVVSLASLQQAIDEFVPAHPVENRAAASDAFAAVRIGEARVGIAPLRSTPPANVYALPDGPVAYIPSSVLHTSAWRTMRPVIHLEKCTRCNFCWKFCPDDAIEFDPAGFPVLRPEYCKGCGICAEECPPRTIEMVVESG
jgi:2-oxoacid:acceptor oxidoreductase gamma subunit (pyruvate/2-ketoisovalerate family)/2-oxoacid:acceptor oxidoreductase delta subunit (pyruvate/2-ketoisovalerate family)